MNMSLSVVVWCILLQLSTVGAFVGPVKSPHNSIVGTQKLSSVVTELPDSLDDSAIIAAQACADFADANGEMGRCRVDFDTTVGDETFTVLKSSTEFMQKFVSALCYSMIDGLQQRRQDELMRVAQARAKLKRLLELDQQLTEGEDDDEEESEIDEESRKQRDELAEIIKSGGTSGAAPWDGPVARVYFPDEGNAALAQRDWKLGTDVPACVEFTACGGIVTQDTSRDELLFFFCPQASESENVERILLQAEEERGTNLKLTVFVNPNLVDMGVTGYGYAGRLLRERLIDRLQQTYYLRTLAWGALTRKWPDAFSVWQEDEDAPGGYRLISTLDRLPSNPEVEDIYDLENQKGESKEQGIIGALGEFVDGMMKL